MFLRAVGDDDSRAAGCQELCDSGNLKYESGISADLSWQSNVVDTMKGRIGYSHFFDEKRGNRVQSKNSSVFRYQHLTIYCLCHNAFVFCLK